MGLHSRDGRVGDAQIAYLEGTGGRAVIAGDPETTQNNLMRVVRGEYGLSEVPHSKLQTACRIIGDAALRIVSNKQS